MPYWLISPVFGGFKSRTEAWQTCFRAVTGSRVESVSEEREAGWAGRDQLQSESCSHGMQSPQRRWNKPNTVNASCHTQLFPHHYSTKRPCLSHTVASIPHLSPLRLSFQISSQAWSLLWSCLLSLDLFLLPCFYKSHNTYFVTNFSCCPGIICKSSSQKINSKSNKSQLRDCALIISISWASSAMPDMLRGDTEGSFYWLMHLYMCCIRTSCYWDKLSFKDGRIQWFTGCYKE